MLTSLHSSSPVYRLRAGLVEDSLGEKVRSWAKPERTVIRGAQVQDASSADVNGLHVVIGTHERRLLVVGAIDLQADDRIEHDGETYLIDGKPFTRRSLTSGAITEAALKRHEVRRG